MIVERNETWNEEMSEEGMKTMRDPPLWLLIKKSSSQREHFC